MLRSREPTRNADKEMESRAEFEAVMGNFLRSQVDADVIDKFLSLAHKAWNVTLCRKAGWPVGKFSSALWDPRVESLVDSKPIAVILTTGAMNPGHKGHVHVVKQAQKRLIAAGYKVVGSWISPSNEEYLKEKFAHEEGVILPASLRLELLEEMTRTEPTIEVGKWEVENLQREGACQYFKFPEVCQKLGEFLRANSIYSYGGSHLTVFYACGADLANRRNLWNGLRLKSKSSVSFGVVVVPRGGEPLGNESKSVYVAGCSPGESVEVSSTSVREALQKVENPSCFRAERELQVALGHTASKMLLRGSRS
jgi:nicotinic acid mononucleotide adenylyltransferase